MNTKSLPANPSLEFDKKQAKKLLSELRSGDESALQRLREYHPRFATLVDSSSVALHDAQLVIARQYGFVSWPRWKAYVESRRLDLGERAAELVRAACSGDMRKATMLLDAEPTLASFDLATAATCGDFAALARLLVRDSELARRACGPNAWQPLVYACFSRFLRSDAERAQGIVRSARLLLEHGADPNAHFFEGEGEHRHMQTCIYGAAGIANNAELTRALFDAGATILAGDGEVLYHACEFKDVTCLELVLAAHPPPPAWRGPLPASFSEDPRARDIVSFCLGRALDFDNEAAALLFLKYGANPNLRVSWHQNRTQMHKAALNGRSLGTLTAMLDHGGDFRAEDDRGISPYRYAVRFGQAHLVALFETRGADPATATAEDRQLFAVARGTGSGIRLKNVSTTEVMVQAAWLNDVPVLQRLLDAGADVNAPADLPPLHAACWTGQLAAAKLLVERCASLSARSVHGGTPLGTALHGSEHCHEPLGGPAMKLREEITHGQYAKIVDLLLEAGATLPDFADGSDAVQEVLRRWGAPDRD